MKTLQDKKALEGESLKIKEPTGYSLIFDPLRRDHSLTRNERALLWTLICSAPAFKPTTRALATLLKMDTKTLNKTIKGLKEKGYLIIENPGTKQATWILDQTGTSKPTNYEALEQEAKRGYISLEVLKRLVKAGKITRKQASDLVELARDFLRKEGEAFYGN